MALVFPPRYNAVVNNLIFVAQGNGEEKGEKRAQYYEEPRQVYYRKDFTGTVENYHLKHPKTGQDLE